MNGSINLSMPDGWVPEFAREMNNCFLIRPAPGTISEEEKDILENRNLMDLLENVIMPMYYRNQDQWLSIMKQAAKDIFPVFESARMADEYYMKIYSS